VIFAKPAALLLDTAMCAMMYAIQHRHRLDINSAAALERYIGENESLTRDTYYGPVEPITASPESRSLLWPSPVTSGYPENDHAYADLYPCAAGWSAPTVLMLHALMSASDLGYKRWAADFNARGWNAVFLHLPYHYSRRPRRHWNGELAITADLVRTGQGLRQGVTELRQLMAVLRHWGGHEFGLWSASYGGWIGALLASVERDFRFVALMEPIVDVGHAIWTSPAGGTLRRELRRLAIEPNLIERHFPLISPLQGDPLCGADRVVLCAGDYDHIAPAAEITALHHRWVGSELLRVPQGHFGYRMMPAVWERLTATGRI
jgi:pimeloyl-ACP methyl ester carboxylesterase